MAGALLVFMMYGWSLLEQHGGLMISWV